MAQGHHANYLLIFIALCICTALSVVADLIPPDLFGPVAIGVIVLAIATAKALFVMTFFMHLKFEGAWKFVLLAPTMILALGLPLALLPDIGVHYYQTDVPQNHASEKPDSSHDADPGASH